MSQWWDHLLHTPMRYLAWYDQLLVFGAVLGLLAALFGLEWVRSGRRWRRKR